MVGIMAGIGLAFDAIRDSDAVIQPWVQQNLAEVLGDGALDARAWQRLIDHALPEAWSFESDLMVVHGAAEPGLMDALQKVTGPTTSLAGFQTQAEMQRTAFELLKQLPGGGTNSTVSGMTPVPESFGVAMPEQSLKEWVDFSLLPPFAAVEKYFHFMVFGGSANADGLTLKFYSPVPPGLKK